MYEGTGPAHGARFATALDSPFVEQFDTSSGYLIKMTIIMVQHNVGTVLRSREYPDSGQ